MDTVEDLDVDQWHHNMHFHNGSHHTLYQATRQATALLLRTGDIYIQYGPTCTVGTSCMDVQSYDVKDRGGPNTLAVTQLTMIGHRVAQMQCMVLLVWTSMLLYFCSNQILFRR